MIQIDQYCTCILITKKPGHIGNSITATFLLHHARNYFKERDSERSKVYNYPRQAPVLQSHYDLVHLYITLPSNFICISLTHYSNLIPIPVTSLSLYSLRSLFFVFLCVRYLDWLRLLAIATLSTLHASFCCTNLLYRK